VGAEDADDAEDAEDAGAKLVSFPCGPSRSSRLRGGKIRCLDKTQIFRNSSMFKHDPFKKSKNLSHSSE